MAKRDTTTSNKQLEYRECLWGESILGTKDQLQSLGIAVGLAFPGEPGGPKRQLNVLDPRGFKTSITRYSDGQYSAHVDFPGRSRWGAVQWNSYAPGVQLRTDCTWFDEYVGRPEALVAAGLVCLDQLPGQPGMRKVRVTIFADGTLPQGARGVNDKRSREPGAKTIERASKTTYRVRVILPVDEQERRKEAGRLAEQDYEMRMKSLSRPPRLDGKESGCAQSTFTVTTLDDYRDRVRTMSAMAFGMIERWMFNDAAAPFSFAPEERERLLGHAQSIWHEMSRLIGTGKVVRKASAFRPTLRLVQSNRP